MMTERFSNLSLYNRKLVVSCQAPNGSHLKKDDILIAIAKEVIAASAPALRIAGENCIREIRKLTDIPIIGLIKTERNGFDVRITCTTDEIKQVKSAGANIVAIDSTGRIRPEPLEMLYKYAKSLKMEIFADIATEQEALNAIKIGADYIGTTMSGYTDETKDQIGSDFELLKKLVKETSTPIVLEGKIENPDQCKKALDLGAFAVVVGRFITSPRDITKLFIEAI